MKTISAYSLTAVAVLFLSANTFAMDYQVDTVVVGSGISGLKAALDLKKGGENVVVLEKMLFPGGTTNLAAQYFSVVNTKEQIAAGKVMTIPQYIEREKKTQRNYGEISRIVQRMYDAQEMLDWVNSIGADITRVISSYQLGTKDGSSLGARIMKVAVAEAKKQNVPIKTGMTVVDILEKDGKPIGVLVKDNKNEEHRFFADNIVLATGGFAKNQTLVKKYAPEWAGLPTTTAAGSSGDGVILTDKFNVAVKRMDNIGLNPSIHSSDNVQSSLSAARLEGGIMVNADGKRFCNDYWPDYTQLARWMMAQPGGKSFVVIDEKSMKASKRLQSFKQKGYFLEGQTVEELAKKMEVPAENLKATLERFGNFVRNGKDEDFGRTYNLKTDFSNPPYYAVSVKPGTQVTIGGIDVNDFMQVKTKDGKSINNLYAVGELTFDSGTVHGIWTGTKAAEHILSKK